jgi:hypothetical protein
MCVSMMARLKRIRPGAVCRVALFAVLGCRAAEPAPPAPLLAAVQTFIADSLRPEAAASARQFSVVTDPGGAWASALATAPMSSATRQPTLELYLARAELHGDSAVVHARLVGCTPAVPGMNFYEHTIRLRFLRADGAWQYRGRTTDKVADGGC